MFRRELNTLGPHLDNEMFRYILRIEVQYYVNKLHNANSESYLVYNVQPISMLKCHWIFYLSCFLLEHYFGFVIGFSQ